MQRRHPPSPRHAPAIAAGAFFVALAACSAATLPQPGWRGQPTEALVEVPYPPPPPRIEYVPPKPADGAVWVDGEWTWRGRHWGWRRGRWTMPPAGARFSPWTTVRDARGRLFAASGTWRDARGEAIPEPAPLAIGRARPGASADARSDAPTDGGVPRVDAAAFLEPDSGVLDDVPELR